MGLNLIECGDNDFYLNNMELALDYRIYKAYQVERLIGKGVYGEVYKVIEKSTGKPFAVKKIVDAFQNVTDAKRTYRQLSYLLQLSHPCIIKLQKVITGEADPNNQSARAKNVYAIFELMEMDLSRIIQTCKLEQVQRKYIAMQILAGLDYVHESQLIHRDIKPSNILLNKTCETKICDFGLVRLASEFQSHEKSTQQIFTEYVASKWYRAPQIILNGNQCSTFAIDIWSAGCVIAEMCLGMPLFMGNHNMEQLERIFAAIGMPVQTQIQDMSTEQGKYLLKNLQKFKRTSLTQILCPSASTQQIDLISRMLIFNPSKRISAREALNHPYFDDLQQQKMTLKSYPTQITDHTITTKNKQVSLQVYRQLIEALSMTTKRGGLSQKYKQSSVKSSEFSTESLSKNYVNVNAKSSKNQHEHMQQKSTRQSHSGLLKKYQTNAKTTQQRQKQKQKLNRQQKQKQKQRQSSRHGHETTKGVQRAQSKNIITMKNRSRSRQSMKSANNNSKKCSNSTNKSRSKVIGAVGIKPQSSQNKIKPFKVDSSFYNNNNVNKQDHLIKIPKKKKKQ